MPLLQSSSKIDNRARACTCPHTYFTHPPAHKSLHVSIHMSKYMPYALPRFDRPSTADKSRPTTADKSRAATADRRPPSTAGLPVPRPRSGRLPIGPPNRSHLGRPVYAPDGLGPARV